MNQVNEEDPYPHFLHKFPVSNLTTVTMDGDLAIYYIGFGTIGKGERIRECDKRYKTKR